MAILRIERVKAWTGHRSNTSIYVAVREGTFTRPVKIGQRSVGWPDTEVEAIIQARIAGRPDEQVRELVQRLHAKRAERFAALEAAQ